MGERNYTLNDCVSAIMGIKNILKRHEERFDANEKAFADLCAKFAYFWFEEKKCCFAIIKEIYPKTGEADLICFGDHVSGDVEVLKKRKLVSPDEEMPKWNRWQPIVVPDTRKVLQLISGEPVSEILKDDERIPATATAGDTATA